MSDDRKLLNAETNAFELDLPKDTSALAQFGTPSLPLIEDDYDLVPLLRQATKEELAPLVTYIVKNGGFSAQLPKTRSYRQHYPDHCMYADDIAAEIQKFGANTIANIFRDGRGKPYREILTAAAKKCGIRIRRKDSVADIELKIIYSVLGRAWQNMSPREREELIDSLHISSVPGLKPAAATGGLQALIHASGFAPYKLTVIAANAVAPPLLGHGLSLGVNAALAKSISLFASPVGMAISVFWITSLATGPAYRVILPCILQVALIRQASLEKERKKKKRQRFFFLLFFSGILLIMLLIKFFRDMPSR